jgi:hypothetical protein
MSHLSKLNFILLNLAPTTCPFKREWDVPLFIELKIEHGR